MEGKPNDFGSAAEALATASFLRCFQRLPDDAELKSAIAFLRSEQPVEDKLAMVSESRLQQLVHALFASLDFRYLE